MDVLRKIRLISMIIMNLIAFLSQFMFNATLVPLKDVMWFEVSLFMASVLFGCTQVKTLSLRSQPWLVKC